MSKKIFFLLAFLSSQIFAQSFSCGEVESITEKATHVKEFMGESSRFGKMYTYKCLLRVPSSKYGFINIDSTEKTVEIWFYSREIGDIKNGIKPLSDLKKSLKKCTGTVKQVKFMDYVYHLYGIIKKYWWSVGLTYIEPSGYFLWFSYNYRWD